MAGRVALKALTVRASTSEVAMTNLELLARAVVDRWDNGDLAEAVRELAYEIARQDELRSSFQQEIPRLRNAGEVELDDEPLISEANEGIWVGTWTWIDLENEENSDGDAY